MQCAQGDDATPRSRSRRQACAFIESGSLSKAHRLLQRATQLCRKTLADDGFSEEDVEVELGILTAQLAYVNQRMGEEEAAMKVRVPVLKQMP